MKNQEECICTLATPAGGAIGIIRLSGSNAISLTDKIFQSANGKSLEEAKPYTLHYGEIKDKDGNTIDDVLVSVFRAPHSYTGENSTEISCHGSRYILQQVLHRFTEVGCRQAEPGEYTRRAYLNGKMDLSQAEAVADLIASTNKATHKMALSQLKGHFSNELSLLREKLLKMTSLLELELDFSDHEELEFADRSELQALAEEINHKITTLAHSFETGNALKQGVAVAIVGKTNVGKSTLLNRLLHEEKAIVSDIHGTTRDVIEDTTLIDGITFRFIDTAGIRKTDDVVENIGIERTFQKMEEAKIVIWLLDDQPSASEIEEMKQKNQGKKLLVVFNKMDKLENDKLAFDKLTHSCATIEYIITEVQGKPHPDVITYADLSIDSPYNTYKWAGLPPGPISNPGAVALDAAINSPKTDYYFFRLVDAKAGRHVFSKDFSTHVNEGYIYSTKKSGN